ncbi:BrnT family toxin [Candidatus Thiosymbion oneisti]|uniref:BrnT family toxin n=1 Tax=Candidatus Thiosymbion oneisti TaxID=589554 RepID=UPI00105B6DA6|nr:BrnT family toxin [Candidatus Thiosymbion oneisti]
MNFKWDPVKADLNSRKHGISFDEATTVFGDPFAITYGDSYHSQYELRYLTFGTSIKNCFLVVSHTDQDDSIRLISARPMTRNEIRKYEQHHRR